MSRDVREAMAASLETDFRRRSEINWEDTRVGMVLVRFGLSAWKRGLLDAAQAGGDGRRLRFADFDRAAPSFPVCFHARYCHTPLDTSSLMLLPHLLTHFFDSPAAKHFSEFLSQFGGATGGRPAAVVLNRRGLPGGLVVYDAECRRHLRFARNDRDDVEIIARPSRKRKGLKPVGLAAFATFLRSMVWEPG